MDCGLVGGRQEGLSRHTLCGQRVLLSRRLALLCVSWQEQDGKGSGWTLRGGGSAVREGQGLHVEVGGAPEAGVARGAGLTQCLGFSPPLCPLWSFGSPWEQRHAPLCLPVHRIPLRCLAPLPCGGPRPGDVCCSM